MQNPVAVVIDKTLHWVLEQEPNWEKTHPPEFRLRVVERWKKMITSKLEMNTRILWQLRLGDNVFGCMAPIFCTADWNYNPYSVEVSGHELRKLLQ